MDSVLDLITETAITLLGVKASAITRYDDDLDGLVLVRQKNFSFPENLVFKPGDGTAARAFQERHPVWVNDTKTDPTFKFADPALALVAELEVLGSSMSAPIIIRDQSYGAITVNHAGPHDFTEGEIQLFQTLADSAAVAIGNARFIEETQQAREVAETREREANQLQEITAQLASSTDMDNILGLITQKAVELLKPDGSGILRYDSDRGGLVIARGFDFLERLTTDLLIFPGEGTTGRAFQERRPRWSGDPYQDDTFNYSDEATDKSLRELAPKSALSCPIIIRDEPYGVLVVVYYIQHDFSQPEIQLLQTLADSAAVAIGNARFIDQTQQARQDAEEAREEAKDANKELDAFNYSVSHDLRAPLRSIDGFSQALLEDYEDQLDEQAKDYLERSRAASQRMGILIDDLLNLSQVTRTEIRREKVDLSALAQLVVSDLQQRDPDRNVVFEVAKGAEAVGDPNLLRAVLDNLIGNAWKYTGKQPQAKIEFGITEHDGQRAYFVRDDGVGFDMAHADKLFGAFQRLHGANEFEGTGIGLATVQRIIHRHGGRVWAESTVEKEPLFISPSLNSPRISYD